MRPLILLACFLMGRTTGLLPDSFVSLSAKDKQNLVWSNILAEVYPPAQMLPRSTLSSDNLTDPNYLTLAFGQELDEMPIGRPKIVGTNGIAAKADFVIYPNSTYSGIFKAGSTNTAIVRMSANTAENLVTFFAVKVYIDGNTSQNLHMLHDVLGWNTDIQVVDILEWSMQTGTPAPIQDDFTSGRYSATLNQSFTECVRLLPGGPTHRPNNIWALGNVEPASMENNGYVPNKVIAPWNIQITPNRALRPLNITFGKDDFRNLIATIPANTLIYHVTAKKSPCDEWDTIGEIYTRSEWVASRYHDAVMRFGQPYEQWGYSYAAPGVYCSVDASIVPQWVPSEIALVEVQAQGKAPPSVAYGNTNGAITGLSGGVLGK